MNENKSLQAFPYSIQNEASSKPKEEQSSILTPWMLYDPNEFLRKPHKNFTRISSSIQQSESELELSNVKDKKGLEQSEEKQDKDEVQEPEKIVPQVVELPSKSRKKLLSDRDTDSQITVQPEAGKEKIPDHNYDIARSLDLPPPHDYQSNSFLFPANQDELQKKSANVPFRSSPRTQSQITTTPHRPKPRTNLRVSFLINQHPTSSANTPSLPLPPSSSLKASSTLLPNQDALNARIFTIVSQFYLVTKFVRVLRNSTIYKSPKYLKKDNFSLINDLSFYLEGWKRNYNIYATNHSMHQNIAFLAVQWIFGRWRLFKGIGKAFKRVNVVFDPINPLRIAWDCMQMGLLVCFFMLIPVQIGFGVDLAEELGSFKDFSFYLFLLDFLVNLNTAYYEKGELIKRRHRIVQHYIGLSLLPNLVQDSLPLIFYLRLFTLRKILIRIQEYLFIEEKAYNRLSLLKVIVAIVFFSHVLACIWHYIGSLRQENWMTELDIAQLSWVSRYLYSYYYVVVVMNTVGFGDIVPKNDLERVVAILFIYVACGMFAYTINSIGVIVQDLNKRNKEFNRSVSLVNGYMKQKKINFNLRIRVQKYLEYIWLEKSGQNEEETQKIINKLSKSLKEELLLSANGVIFKNLPLFYMNFSEETLRRVVYQIKEVSLVPGDMLFDRDDVGEEKALYIVKKGEVDMMGEGMHVIRKVGEGGVCGEVSFFSGRSRECYARSSTFTSLYVLHREDFLNIISSNAHDYERFCEIKDKINVYQNAEDLYIRCSSCSREDHGVLFCPLLHLTLEKQRIIARFTYSKEQERGEGNRRNNKSSAKKNLKNNSVAALLINRNFREKDKQAKEEEEEGSEMEEESHLSSGLDDDARTSKRSFNYIVECSNSNLISNNDNLLAKPKNLNLANSIVSDMIGKGGTLAFLDEGEGGEVGGGAAGGAAGAGVGGAAGAAAGGGAGGGGGGAGAGAGAGAGGGGGGGGGLGLGLGGEKQGTTDFTKRSSMIPDNNKHSSGIPTTLINNIEKLLLNVPLARKTPGIVQMSSEDPLGSVNEVSKNYKCYFPDNNIESIVNFINRFCDSKQRHRKRLTMSPDDFSRVGRKMGGGMRMIERGDRRMARDSKNRDEEGRRNEVIRRKKNKRERKKDEGKGRREGGKRTFFSAHFDREKEMMRHNGIVDRERIVVLLRKLERKKKGWLERWCCFWGYIWKGN